MPGKFFQYKVFGPKLYKEYGQVSEKHFGGQCDGPSAGQKSVASAVFLLLSLRRMHKKPQINLIFLLNCRKFMNPTRLNDGEIKSLRR